MDLSTPAFEDGGDVPLKHGYMGENVNPQIDISGAPEEAESLALIVDDPDAVDAAGKIWVHWLLWNVSADTSTIEEGSAPGIEGETDFREKGYNGPNPPDGAHRYVFRLYALDSELELEEGAEREELEEAMEGHVLEEATVEGVFDPDR